MTKERRKTTRFLYKNPILIHKKSKVYKAQILNLSLLGALIKITTVTLQVGDAIGFTLALSTADKKIQVKGRAIVIRKATSHCWGIQFVRISSASLSWLRSIAEYNIGDAEKVFKELKAFVK